MSLSVLHSTVRMEHKTQGTDTQKRVERISFIPQAGTGQQLEGSPPSQLLLMNQKRTGGIPQLSPPRRTPQSSSTLTPAGKAAQSAQCCAPQPPTREPFRLFHFLFKRTGDIGRWKRICRQCQTNEVVLLVRTGAKINKQHREVILRTLKSSVSRSLLRSCPLVQ